MIGTKSEHRLEMKKSARMIRGLASVLQDDAEYMRIDAEGFDLVGLTEAIREGKETVKLLSERMAELECLVFLAKDAIGGDACGSKQPTRC